MTRVVDGERGSRRERIEVLTEGIGCDGFVIGSDELVKLDGEQI